MKKILTILLITLAVSSCKVDREPYGSMRSKEISANPEESIDGLLNGTYAQLKAWSDPMHRLGEYAGDNIVIRGSSTDAFYEFISFARTPNNGRLTTFWDSSYKAIAQASNIINMIPLGKNATLDSKIGECYYIRGMMYFYLVRAYGRPYYQNPETNLGVPIVNGTPEDLKNATFPDRSTVKATYEQAIADLKKAEELITVNRGPIFASKAAAQAMLSRVYLYMSGTYENPNQAFAQLAVDYANKVISSPQYSLLPREQFMKYNTYTPENNKETIFAIKRVASEFSGFDHYYGVGGMYSNIGGMGWGEMYSSAKYLALLDETGRNDWRPNKYKIVDARAAFIEPTYSKNSSGATTEVFRFIKDDVNNTSNYVQLNTTRNGGNITCAEGTNVFTLTPIDATQEIYSITYKDGKTYTGVIDNFITLNRVYPQFYIVKCSREGEDSQLHSPLISRLGEVYLNRAEAYAKLQNYTSALNDLNTIRNRSIVNGGYTSLNATNAGERIDKERQLELAYQAERSFDVFRNGKALTRAYPGPQSQTASIAATDFRVVYYIPQSAINAYAGKLTQNPTQ
ncbi:RagB/SusD family nutrient uptake outer membrane protein [Pedobacter chitinilyticus]|uniref:RagB/SusD family nutrient uptake outer membrane protein n=1 Tax=Pedobacter chitinilyticus TaxID=2233776 RepID=A0A443YXE1_9SPHI|nr:RagB/SusD family nutrient uptake outer membrane protein [Pedobacter chitinilyticus]RWU08644.1 RagB/SusD family nutrient uptake outer membrane protein [Pedobacter chitinilyticus]